MPNPVNSASILKDALPLSMILSALLICPLSNLITYDDRFIIPSQFFFYYSAFIGVCALVAMQLKKGGFELILSRMDIVCLFVLIYIFFRYFPSNTASISGHVFLKLIGIVCVYSIFKCIINLTAKNLMIVIITVLSTVSCCLCLHAILEYFNVLPNGSFFAILGVFRNPGTLTNYFAVVLPFLLTAVFYLKNIGNRYLLINALNMLSLVLISILLVLINQRTALMAALFSCIGVLILLYKQKMRKVFNSKAFFVCTLIIALAVISELASFSYHFRQESAEGRLFIYQNTIKIIKDNILFGVGYDKFPAVYNLYQSQWFKSHPHSLAEQLASDVKVPFNEYLHVWSELGLIGLILCLGVFLITFKQLKTLIRANRLYSHDMLVLGAFGGLVSALICSFFSYPFSESSIIILVLLFLSILNQGKVLTLKVNNIGSIGVLGITAFFLYQTTSLLNIICKWQETAVRAQQGHFNQDTYNRLYQKLDSHYGFLFNYGVELLFNGQYTKSVKILERAKGYYVNTDLFVFLGDAYKGANQRTKAEVSYLNAVYMVPKKFIPKYALLEFYADESNCDRINYWASRILNTREIIHNPKVGLIKQKTLQILKNKCNSY